MAVNLFRSDPGQFANQIKDLKRMVPELKGNGDLIEKICKDLASKKPQGKMCFDETANKACIQNNKAVCAKNEKEPTQKGGNIEIFNNMLQEQGKSSAVCFEFTQYDWEHPATYLVAYQIVQSYKSLDPNSKLHILDDKVTSFGMSYMSHKSLENVIQILYVQAPSNQIE